MPYGIVREEDKTQVSPFIMTIFIVMFNLRAPGSIYSKTIYITAYNIYA